MYLNFFSFFFSLLPPQGLTDCLARLTGLEKKVRVFFFQNPKFQRLRERAPFLQKEEMELEMELEMEMEMEMEMRQRSVPPLSLPPSPVSPRPSDGVLVV